MSPLALSFEGLLVTADSEFVSIILRLLLIGFPEFCDVHHLLLDVVQVALVLDVCFSDLLFCTKLPYLHPVFKCGLRKFGLSFR